MTAQPSATANTANASPFSVTAAAGGGGIDGARVITSVEEFRSRPHGSSTRSSSPNAGGGSNSISGVGVKGSSAPRYSGVQREILSLYRELLRETRRMQDADTQSNMRRYMRQEFDKDAAVPRKHIAKIEWCLNTGKRKLEELQRMGANTKFAVRF